MGLNDLLWGEADGYIVNQAATGEIDVTFKGLRLSYRYEKVLTNRVVIHENNGQPLAIKVNLDGVNCIFNWPET